MWSYLLKDIWGMLDWTTVIVAFKFIIGTIKELRYDVKFYKYEICIPHWERERKVALGESFRRINRGNKKPLGKNYRRITE